MLSKVTRILAADDDVALGAVLGRQLRAWGYETILATTGADAWRVLKQENGPRVAILDWDMPGLSGLEVCRLLRATPHGADAYVLILTGRLEKAHLVEALESGADEFLSKPYESRELQLRLARALRDRRPARISIGPPSTGIPPSGATLGRKYRLEGRLGEGGMGSVRLGVHLSLGVNVAIKFMARHLADTAHYASFEREARAAAQLRSEHSVRVYDHGLTEDGLPYLVMEYLAGEPLSAWVQREGPLGPDAVATLVEQMASALTEAHGHGIVHGDVKPENILMAADPSRPSGFVARLIDFGLAKSWHMHVPEPALASEPPGAAVPSSRAPPSQGTPPVIGGTPCYMSPECLSSRVAPNPALDLWGLAVTAFFATTGVLPFQGDNPLQLLERVTLAPLPVPSEVTAGVPGGFDAWFALACARDPTMRFQTAFELAVALRATSRDAAEGPTKTPAPAPSVGVFAATEPDSGPVMALEDGFERATPRGAGVR
jgi:serine/threonine-protein kinase